MSTRRKRTTGDPRKAGGTIAGPGGPHDRAGIILDTSRAVLLDGVHVAQVDATRDGEPTEPLLGMLLSGRINQTPDLTSILYLLDVDGAAAISTEILALMGRAGLYEEYARKMGERWAALRDQGATQPAGQGESP